MIAFATRQNETAKWAILPRADARAGEGKSATVFNWSDGGDNITVSSPSTHGLLGFYDQEPSNVASVDQSNQQYSITALTDASGNVSERYAYTAYGQPTFLNASGIVQTSSAANNRYTYTGREWDTTLGLHHFRARWMSGLTGRFLTRDPIGYKGKSKNLYQYVRARPLDRRDPSGLYLIKEDYIPGTNVRPEWTNCAGFALHPNESAIDPILGLEGMLTGLGYTCQLGQSASGCLDKCKKGKNCTQLYVYKMRGVDEIDVDDELIALVPTFRDLDARVIDVTTMILFHWREVLEMLEKKGVVHPKDKGTVIDYHVLKCKENQFVYQPCLAPKNGNFRGCDDLRSDPKTFIPTPEDPEFFPNDRTLFKMCCCKKDAPAQVQGVPQR